jgi:hypothetical protein
VSFGYVLLKPHSKKLSNYRHSYHPLVFAQIINENVSAAVFALVALASAGKTMFEFDIMFLGGLVSDSFVNAYAIVFPEGIRG